MTIVFEFFSGIGGFHQALSSLQLKDKMISIKKIFSFDVNTNANIVYDYNFAIAPSTSTLECFKLSEYNSLCEKYKDNGSDIIWLMSPPCQPFTCLGLQKDLNDDRTEAFRNLIENLIVNTKYLPDYLLLENVKNFEYSNAWSMLMKTLQLKRFSYRQFILSPHQLGVPNRRVRYYLLARGPNVRRFEDNEGPSDEIITTVDSLKTLMCRSEEEGSINVKKFLNIQHDYEEDYVINKILYLNDKHFPNEYTTYNNICKLSSTITNCFTKSYGKLYKGAGSTLHFEENFERNKNLKGKVRFFTPEEIMKFMCFNPSFKFPNNFSLISKYKLLGNSINIKVVTILLKYLLHTR